MPISGLSVDVTIMLDYQKWHTTSYTNTLISQMNKHFPAYWTDL